MPATPSRAAPWSRRPLTPSRASCPAGGRSTEAGLGAGKNRYHAGSAQHGPDHIGGRDFIQPCDLLERSDNFMDAPMCGPADPDRFDMEGYTSNFGYLVEQGGTQTRVSCSPSYSSNLVEQGGAQTRVSCSPCYSSNLVEQGGMQTTVSCRPCNSSNLVEPGGTPTIV